LNYPEFQLLVNKNDTVCFVETTTGDIDEINLPDYEFKMKIGK